MTMTRCKIPPNPPFAKEGTGPTQLRRFLPLAKGGQEGFNSCLRTR